MSLREHTILNKLRKHLELHNIQEQTDTPTAQKYFQFSPLQPNCITIEIKQASSVFDDALLIKLIDSFLSEVLLMDSYGLKMQYPPGDREALKTALSIMSISFIEQELSGDLFQFTTRYANQIFCLASGKRSPNAEDLFVNLYIDKILTVPSNLQLPSSPTLFVIIPENPAQKSLALVTASTLARKGQCIDILLNTSVPTSERFEQARKMGAKKVFIIGDEEQKNSTITISDLFDGTVKSVLQINITEI